MKIDGNLARNIDFEVTNFQVLRKIRGKTSILTLWRKSRAAVKDKKNEFVRCAAISSWFELVAFFAYHHHAALIFGMF